MNHEYYMQMVFALALKGIGHTSPNALVGAVLVRDNLIIGTGYLQKYGSASAVVSAIADAQGNGLKVEGATLYCNLEVSSPIIYEEKISQVVISCLDLNPKICGRGVEDLRSHGIEVITDILLEEGQQLNEVYFKFMTSNTPFIHLARAEAQKSLWALRQKYDCVLVDRKSIEQSNLSLTVDGGDFEVPSQPLRMVLGKLVGLNRDWPIFHDQWKRNTMMVATDEEVRNNQEIVRFLDAQGVALLSVKQNEEGLVDLAAFLKSIGSLKLTSILVEDTGSLAQQLWALGLVDKFGA